MKCYSVNAALHLCARQDLVDGIIRTDGTNRRVRPGSAGNALTFDVPHPVLVHCERIASHGPWDPNRTRSREILHRFAAAEISVTLAQLKPLNSYQSHSGDCVRHYSLSFPLSLPLSVPFKNVSVGHCGVGCQLRVLRGTLVRRRKAKRGITQDRSFHAWPIAAYSTTQTKNSNNNTNQHRQLE